MNSHSQPRAKRQPAQTRRENILAGARDVFARSSYGQADTAELAAAAGVKAPALYRYFPTKRDLYLATLADAGPRLLAIWERALAAFESPADGIWEIGMGYYDHTVSRSPMMRLWFQAVGETADPEVRTLVRETLGGSVALIASAIAKGQANGQFRRDLDARAAAWYFMGIGFSMDLLFQLGFEDDLTRDEAEAWGRMFLESLRSSAGAEPTTWESHNGP